VHIVTAKSYSDPPLLGIPAKKKKKGLLKIQTNQQSLVITHATKTPTAKFYFK
jgi:hypothetical protein